MSKRKPVITFNEKGKHLTYEHRRILGRAWNAAVRGMAAWISFIEFARRMGIETTTWMREYYHGGGTKPVRDLKHPGRWVYGEYDPDLAQEVHDENEAQKGRRMKFTNKIDREFARLIHDKRRHLSPADARIEIMEKHPDWNVPCLSTFYHHIRNGSSAVKYGETPYHPDGPRRKAGPKPHPARTAFGRRGMKDRPAPANERSEDGHWEMDTVVSCLGGRGGLLVLFDRRRRIYVCRYIRSISQRAVLRCLRRLVKNGDLDIIRSVTTDNGVEFLNQKRLDAALKSQVYYTRSYAAWEKGSVENANRLLRRWFPKGTDFSKVSRKEVAWAEECINAIHRRSLGWMSAKDLRRKCAA